MEGLRLIYIANIKSSRRECTNKSYLLSPLELKFQLCFSFFHIAAPRTQHRSEAEEDSTLLLRALRDEKHATSGFEGWWESSSLNNRINPTKASTIFLLLASSSNGNERKFENFSSFHSHCRTSQKHY